MEAWGWGSRWEVHRVRKRRRSLPSATPRQRAARPEAGESGPGTRVPVLLGQGQVSLSTPKITGDGRTPRAVSASGIDRNCPVCLPPSRCTDPDSSCGGRGRGGPGGRAQRAVRPTETSSHCRPPGLHQDYSHFRKLSVGPSNTAHGPEGGAVQSVPAELGLALLVNPFNFYYI